MKTGAIDFRFPIETLYYYDGPCLFSATSDGELLLCVLTDDDHENRTATYLAVPTTPETVADVRENRMFLREAFTRGEGAWMVTWGESGANAAEAGEMTDDVLPAPGVYLSIDATRAAKSASEARSDG